MADPLLLRLLLHLLDRLLRLEQGVFQFPGIVFIHTSFSEKFSKFSLHCSRKIHSAPREKADSYIVYFAVNVSKPIVLLFTPWFPSAMFLDEVSKLRLRLLVFPLVFVVIPTDRNDATDILGKHLILSEDFFILWTLPPIIQVVFMFQTCNSHDNRHLLPTDDLIEQNPVCPTIPSDPPSHAKDEQTHAIELPDKCVKSLNCLPVRNTTLFSFVETCGVIDTEFGIAELGTIALVLECATFSSVGDFSNSLAYEQVDDRTLAATRLTEQDNVVMLWLLSIHKQILRS